MRERERERERSTKDIIKYDAKDHRFLLTSTGLIPISIITAPGFIQLPLTIFGWPTAEIIISASLMYSSGFLVLEWTILMVASSL